MEKVTPFNSNPSLPRSSFISHKKNQTNATIHILRTVGGTSTDAPSSSSSSSLGFPAYFYAHSVPMKLNSAFSSQKIHTQMVKTRNDLNCTPMSTRLVDLYIESGDFQSAAHILFMGFQIDPPFWSRWVEEFGAKPGRSSELFLIFKGLHSKGKIRHVRILVAFLKACAASDERKMGLNIHSYIIKSALGSDACLISALLEFYANCFGFGRAHKLFDKSPFRESTILWNKLIAINSGDGSWPMVLEVFREMQISGVRADCSSLTQILQACSRRGALKEGKQIHAHFIRCFWMPVMSPFVCNSLISMYSKCSKLEMARNIFDRMESRSLVSWNAMISGYASNGILSESWKLFDEMEISELKPDLVTWNCLVSGHSIHGQEEIPQILRRMQSSGLKPDSSSIASALRGIGEMRSVELGKEIHGYVIRNGLECDTYVGTSLISMLLKNDNLTDARLVFDQMKDRNIVTWNSLISGYAYSGKFDQALDMINRMEKEGIRPSLVTWNSLIAGYAMKGCSRRALELVHQLEKIPGSYPNVISWTALISSSVQTEKFLDALKFCIKMQQAGVDPNSATISTLLQACAALAFLQKGRELHSYAIRKGFTESITVATALVDMYYKSGSLSDSHKVFRKTENKNVACWNSMIMGFSVYGLGKEAISLFDAMCQSGIHPDGISFTAVLSGCRHSWLVDKGWKYFDSMDIDFGISPSLVHYTCMVDLLGRSGYLDEAWDFLQSMPVKPDAGVWGALLAACSLHKNLELAEIAANHLFKLEPSNSRNYFLLMNLYAMKNRWKEVENIKDAMGIAGAKNIPTWSWIQIKSEVHVFSGAGKPHPDIGKIYFQLYHLISEIKKLGYVPDTSCVVQNLKQEEKEKILVSHTEKLAITYGLMNTREGIAIRVIKNTRMCNDCHAAAKYLSLVSSREIFLRDSVRFHRFAGGSCSCNDSCEYEKKNLAKALQDV